MPAGKPAGEVCINLETETMRCRIWGTSSYPQTCRSFRAEVSVCGESREEAIRLIGELEQLTR